MFGWLKLPNRRTPVAVSLWRETVAAARAPVFYEFFDVPDTRDGRFDMIVLHAALVVCRLQGAGPQGAALAQEYFDRMFVEMDRAVREMGVGDLSVRGHVRRMMKAFYGRAEAYHLAIRSRDAAALEQALRRNLYGTLARPPGEVALGAMARYVFLCADALNWQEDAALLAGRAGFPPPPAPGPQDKERDHETQTNDADRAGMVLRD